MKLQPQVARRGFVGDEFYDIGTFTFTDDIDPGHEEEAIAVLVPPSQPLRPHPHPCADPTDEWFVREAEREGLALCKGPNGYAGALLLFLARKVRDGCAPK